MRRPVPGTKRLDPVRGHLRGQRLVDIMALVLLPLSMEAAMFIPRPSILAVGIVILALGPLVAQENLEFKPPPGWDLGNVQQTRDAMVMEFVRKGETVDRWTELLTINQMKLGKKALTYRESFESSKARFEQQCAGVTEWNVIDETDGRFVYEWKTSGPCMGHPPQTELVRLLYAKRSGYRVGYSTRSELTAEGRAAWLEWLRGLRLWR